jgi:hypothetical protein
MRFWKRDPWYLNAVVWTWSTAADRMRALGDDAEADLLIALCGRKNPGLNSFLREAFLVGADGNFKFPTTAAAKALPTIKLPDKLFFAHPHMHGVHQALTLVRIKPLDSVQQTQVNAISHVALAVVHAHAIGTTITLEDIKQGFAQRQVERRARDRGLSSEEITHAKACATIGIAKMLEFYGAPRERLVALLVAAVTGIPVTHKEVRVIAERMRNNIFKAELSRISPRCGASR